MFSFPFLKSSLRFSDVEVIPGSVAISVILKWFSGMISLFFFHETKNKRFKKA